MFNNFGVNVVNLFKKLEEERYNLKHPYVGTEHLILTILKYNYGRARLFFLNVKNH